MQRGPCCHFGPCASDGSESLQDVDDESQRMPLETRQPTALVDRSLQSCLDAFQRPRGTVERQRRTRRHGDTGRASGCAKPQSREHSLVHAGRESDSVPADRILTGSFVRRTLEILESHG